MKQTSRFAAAILMLSGTLILSVVFLPLAFSTLRFSFFSPPKLLDPTAVSVFPVPYIVDVLGVTTDFSEAGSWFPTSNLDLTPQPTKVAYFTLSVPGINLIDIPVKINGTDLKINPIHFPGTALPGQPGNTVIFGHSSLPLLYRPNNPLTIFNPILDAKIGDEIIVKYDGVTYKYRIQKTFEVTPDQIEVLAQHINRRELTLITCVPLGTYWRRYIVVSDLVI